jgi:2-methylcitrate dehydratase PrpD
MCSKASPASSTCTRTASSTSRSCAAAWSTARLVDDLSLKPYPACRFTHAPIDLALQLHERGVRPQDVKHIRIRVSGQAVNMVGRKFDYRTAGVVDAQFSIAYTVAVGLARGAVRIGDFVEETLRDPRVGAFAARRSRSRPTRRCPTWAWCRCSSTSNWATARRCSWRPRGGGQS